MSWTGHRNAGATDGTFAVAVAELCEAANHEDSRREKQLVEAGSDVEVLLCTVVVVVAAAAEVSSHRWWYSPEQKKKKHRSYE